MEIPSVLILGGAGFIGRNLLKFLLDNQLSNQIRVVDKSRPELLYMMPDHAACFKHEHVQYIQADLAKADHVTGRAFGGEEHWDYIVNLCGETRFGQSQKDYELKCERTATNCVTASQAHAPKKYIEVSTAQVYKPDKNPSTEKAPLKPWTLLATSRLRVEEVVQKTPELPWVILRPAMVYGHGDQTSLAPRIVSAAIYQKTKEKMKFLWGKDLKINTVHVEDLCAAIWIACTQMKPTSIYNVADDTDLTQGKLAEMLGEVFGIATGFMGGAVSMLASTNLKGAADYVNEKHVPAWATMCQDGAVNTPLSPFVDKELLKNQHMAVNGKQLTQDFEFKYTHQVCADEIRAFTAQAVEQGIFPVVTLS